MGCGVTVCGGRPLPAQRTAPHTTAPRSTPGDDPLCCAAQPPWRPTCRRVRGGERVGAAAARQRAMGGHTRAAPNLATLTQQEFVSWSAVEALNAHPDRGFENALKKVGQWGGAGRVRAAAWRRRLALAPGRPGPSRVVGAGVLGMCVMMGGGGMMRLVVMFCRGTGRMCRLGLNAMWMRFVGYGTRCTKQHTCGSGSKNCGGFHEPVLLIFVHGRFPFRTVCGYVDDLCFV